MQLLERALLSARAASPTNRICARIAHDGRSVEFYPLTICESCGREIALSAVKWEEWGWYRGDYNRAQAYADTTTYAHDAHDACN